MIFCDTSTLAKYYVPEYDSAEVRARLDKEDQVALSELARAELMGVFHRRLREHKWTKDEFLAVVRQFTKDDIGGYWSWLPLDGVIVEQSVKTFTPCRKPFSCGLRIASTSSPRSIMDSAKSILMTPTRYRRQRRWASRRCKSSSQTAFFGGELSDPDKSWCAMQGSNLRLPACEAGALPLS
jgi:hypothetical protein